MLHFDQDVLSFLPFTRQASPPSGARVLVTLLYELHRRNLKRGIAALCLGGGNAVALAVEI